MIESIMHHMQAYPQMWATFGIISVAILLYAFETFSMIMTSLLVLLAFMCLFHFTPLMSSEGQSLTNPDSLLTGFSSPALVAVLALLILGQAVVRTGALTPISNGLIMLSNRAPLLAVILALFFVAVISAFMNNTPTVIIFIPILLAVAANLKQSASAVMIPLSYASILGGGLVLIGSSTNLLVSAAVQQTGMEPLGFFDFTVPGAVIAGVGMLYVTFILPYMLPERAPLSDDLTGAGRQFVAQLEVKADSAIVNKVLNKEELFGDKELTIKMLQRKDHAFLPPFDDDVTVQSGDILVITATRETIKILLTKQSELFQTSSTIGYDIEEGKEVEGDSALTEVLITPASKLIGQTIEQVGFHNHYQCLVLGMQRKSRAITSAMTKTRLQPGDVLLVMASREDIRALRNSKDMLVMEWSTEELPSKKLARRVIAIFTGVVAVSIAGIMPIHLSALIGAALVILSGGLNMRQAMRSLDGNIIFLVAAGLAMSIALQETGGAALLAEEIITMTHGVPPVFVMSALFFLMAILTNILSNNATALLFTPIAINTANQLGAPPEMFIFAVIFASNCCALASPIGYQTNLLVMGPGHYTFADYMKAGIPLIILIWITYTAFSYVYF